MSKKDYKNLVILEVIAIALILLLTRGKYVFGSTVDWPYQHYFFADFFRKLFYDTGNFFPSFAFNIGNGQNIFYFSYYGLYSPIFLISYLLPFINMGTFIQQAMAVLVVLCTLFYYKWLRRRFNSTVSFLVALAFLTAAPILFHASRHIMFISYMPFILLGFFGVDAYFKDNSNKSKVMLAIAVLGIILSNYFFSIVGIFTIVLYGIYVYLENHELHIKEFLNDGWQFLVPLLYGVLLSMFFVLPTFYAVLEGRVSTTTHINLLEQFIPNFDVPTILYSAYSYGLSLLAIFGFVNAWFSKKVSQKWIAIVLTILTFIPIFAYILNGFMYVEYKIFIPLIPLIGMFIGFFIQDVIAQKLTRKIILLVLAFVVLSSIVDLQIFVLVDLLVLLIVLVAFLKNKKVGTIFLTVYLIGFGLINAFQANLIPKATFYKANDTSVKNRIEEVLEKEKNIYRFNYDDYDLYHINNILNMNYYNSSVYSSLSNLNNRDAFVNVFQNEISYRNNMILNESNNILYNIYMGNKYLYSTNNQMYGYEEVDENIYTNPDVFPIGYATYQVMSLDYYKTLKYPYTMEALLNYIVVDEKRIINDYETNIEEYNYDFSSLIKDNPYIQEEDGKYTVNNTTGKDLSIDVDVDENLKNKILIIDFNMNYDEKCSVGDQAITIFGQKNVYTCKEWKYNNKNSNFSYVISLDKVKENTIVFSKGKHIISDIKFYLLDYEDVKRQKQDLNEFQFNKEKTKGDKIIGTIDVEDYGYFVFTIPYDEGFKITMDGKKVEYRKVNQDFIGFKIKPGKHEITLIYDAPFSNLGKMISLLTLLFFVLYLNKDRLKELEKKIEEMHWFV